MTVMMRRLKVVLTRPLFVNARNSGAYGVWVSRWTEQRPLAPPMPTFEDSELEDLFDGLFSTAA